MKEEFRHFPSWVQKWIYEADTFHAKDSTLSLKDAMMKADPADIPSISCDSYEYYEDVVFKVLEKHYLDFREFYKYELWENGQRIY